MSRIHEALKKAAQERSANTSAGSTEELLNLSASAAVSPRTAEKPDVKLPENFRPDSLTGALQFEEFSKQCIHTTWQPNPQSNVFHGEGGNEQGSEPFRTLRSRLYQVAATKKLKKMLITSSVPAEGKTFVAANLAQSIVRQGERRVLLLDADLRAPRLHLALGAPNTPGLSDYLSGDVSECSVTQKGQEGNLFFIPGGTLVSNPSELLLGKRMSHLLEVLTPLFDWIIIDSPPTLPVHDASILADLSDGVLFIVRAGATDFEIAQKASAEFRGKNLLGVVLNRTDRSNIYGGYYYGHASQKHGEKID
jgi:protein-tyrosine kinase